MTASSYDAEVAAKLETQWRKETSPTDIGVAEAAVKHLSQRVVDSFTATLHSPEELHDNEVRTLIDSITNDDLLSCTQLDSGKRTCSVSLTENNQKLLRLFRLISTPAQLAMVCNKINRLVISNYPVTSDGRLDRTTHSHLYKVIKYNYLSIFNSPDKPALQAAIISFGIFNEYSDDSFDKLEQFAKHCLSAT